MRRPRRAFARECQQFAAQCVARLEAVLERDERLDDLHRDGVGLADHAGFGDGRMLDQHAFHLERTDEVARGLDDVVLAPDEPKVSVGVAPRQVAGRDNSRRRSTSGSAPARSNRRETSTASRDAAPVLPRRSAHRHFDATPVVGAITIAASIPGSGRPIEPGRISMLAIVGDHDSARFGLPPVVVKRQSEASRPQTTASGSTARRRWPENARRQDRCSFASSAPTRISTRIAVGAVYQTVTRSFCSSRYQRSASKSPSSTMLVTPLVSGAIMPYDVPVTQPGSAVHQKISSGVQIQGQLASHVMCQDGPMDVHGPFRSCRSSRL